MMTVEEKPDVTYDDVGGCKEALEKLREVVELPPCSASAPRPPARSVPPPRTLSTLGRSQILQGR